MSNLTLSEEKICGLQFLLEAHLSAADVKGDSWDFAVEIARLRDLGLNETDFRWLTCKGFVLHAREVSHIGDDARCFEREGRLAFTTSSCFVLTTTGFEFATSLAGQFDSRSGSSCQCQKSEPCLTNSLLKIQTPVFDLDKRELCFLGQTIKRFKLPSPNQETVLIAFEEEGWPPRIDDPLPPRDEQDPKQRLHDTIKCLNRNQMCNLIRFRGDGTGQGVRWCECQNEVADAVVRTAGGREAN